MIIYAKYGYILQQFCKVMAKQTDREYQIGTPPYHHHHPLGTPDEAAWLVV